MRHKWFLDNLSRVGTVHGIRIETVKPQAFEPSSPKPLNRHPLNLEPSPHRSFHSKMTNPWGEGATKEGKNLG